MKEARIPVTRENYIATNWGEPAAGMDGGA